jgi:hypothetical protein
MHALEVGKPYIAGRTNWPEAVEYSYRGGEHEVRMFLSAPSVQEVESVRSGKCEFALAIERPVIFLLYCFPPAIDWSDAPYSCHLVPENDRALPGLSGPETRALLHVTLVDGATGLVRVLHVVSLSPAFTRALDIAIVEQALSRWVGRAAYDAALADIYRRYRHSAELLFRAVRRTQAGE